VSEAIRMYSLCLSSRSLNIVREGTSLDRIVSDISTGENRMDI
jgi:hypothetical protein